MANNFVLNQTLPPTQRLKISWNPAFNETLTCVIRTFENKFTAEFAMASVGSATITGNPPPQVLVVRSVTFWLNNCGGTDYSNNNLSCELNTWVVVDISQLNADQRTILTLKDPNSHVADGVIQWEDLDLIVPEVGGKLYQVVKKAFDEIEDIEDAFGWREEVL